MMKFTTAVLAPSRAAGTLAAPYCARRASHETSPVLCPASRDKPSPRQAKNGGTAAMRQADFVPSHCNSHRLHDNVTNKSALQLRSLAGCSKMGA